MSSGSDIVLVVKSLERYEMVTGAKINRDKSSAMGFGVWRLVDLSGSFCWTGEFERILRL